MRRAMLAALMILAVLPGIAGYSGTKPQSPKTAAQAPSDGERAFHANCGRCHKPPEQLSPSSVPAVIRHMRVRAMLPEKDVQAIVRYLAP